MSTIQRLTIFLLVFFSAGMSQTGKITGTVVDNSTQEPIIGANIVVEKTTLGGITDIEGKFEINNVPAGTVSIRVSMLGYKQVVKTDVVVTTTKSTTVNVGLDATTLDAEEVVVTAEYFSKPKEVTTSLQSLSFEEIRRAPGSVADISRMVQTLPGVVQTSDSRNDLIVRGGSPAENLNVIDGFEIPSLNHFGTQGTSGGAIGMMQTEFISEAAFLTGGFPVKYGDKMSSVLDIRMREGNAEIRSGSFDLSMAGAGVIAEGPIGKSSTFLFSARRSYLDLVFKSTGFTAVPKYSNINLKGTHRLSRQDFLSMIYLHGWDRIHIKQDPGGKNSEDVAADVDMSGEQRLFGVNWKHLHSGGSYSTVHVWGTENTFKKNISDLVRAPQGTMATGNSSEGQSAMQYEYFSGINKNIDVTAGTGIRSVTLDYNTFRRADTNWFGEPMPEEHVQRKHSLLKGNAYLHASVKPIENLNVTFGARMNYHDGLAGHLSADPRIGMSYEFNPTVKINASYGIFHQSPEAIWIYGSEKPNDGLTFIQTKQSVVGIEYYPEEGMKVSIEGYLKQYNKYPVLTTYPQLSLANSGDGFGAAAASDLVSKGSGTSAGVDLFVQQKLTDDLYGLISYSYSKTQHKALDGVLHDGSFDIPHVFTVSGGYRITSQLEVSTKYRFVSGRPYSRIDESASVANSNLVYDMNSINSERYPNYWRWDMRIDYRTYFESFNLVTYFDVQNVTNRKNIWGFNWDRHNNEKVDIVQYGFFPVGGLKIEF